MSVSIWLAIMALGLTVAAVPTVHRIVVGPTILDRLVAADMMVMLAVAGIGLYAAVNETDLAGAAMLSLTAFAFISTLVVARFVSREDPTRHTAPLGGEESPRERGVEEGLHAERGFPEDMVARGGDAGREDAPAAPTDEEGTR